MPTPDAIVSPGEHEGTTAAGRTTCPPDELRTIITNPTTNIRDSNLNPPHAFNSPDNGSFNHLPPMQLPTPPPQDMSAHAQPPPPESHSKPSSAPIESPARDIPTPMTAIDDAADEHQHRTSHLSSPFPAHRFLPRSSSSLLRPGSRFKGNQTSDRQQYEVEVEVKHVDMRESFMCGYLRIKGLTEDHPSLTTYFEGEIIGSKYNFITQHPEWGSNEKVDRQHWGRFPAYKPLSKYSSRPEMVTKDWIQKEHLFMRWKEYFLVPDHRVRTISGASFEGFYYICFNQVTGGIEGIYFHAKSEKYQRLQLEHVQDHGCQGAIEFR
ncbi:vacuolar import and degradation protein-domain-containing protein [Phaeosphaeriaceae sp. PMI808]|nr:vacuolar import and degradation protein-domain-containing protein [Phaeosphaeriaceae sp. PMI808]